MDFGSNPAPAATTRTKRSADVNHGIATVQLPNGQRLDGYILLTAKNAGKLGITAESLAALVSGKKAGSVAVTLHLQFGERDLAVADAVEIAFA